MRGVNLDQFRRLVDNYADTVVPTIVKEVQGRVVGEVFKKVVVVTPVLTGRARRNWNIGVGSPPDGTTAEVAGVSVTGAPPTTREKQEIDVARKLIQAAPLGITAWIGNNLEYIRFLEQGSSQKAPLGIREVAILGALEGVRFGVGR